MLAQENAAKDLLSGMRTSWFRYSALIVLFVLCSCGKQRHGEAVNLTDLFPLQISSCECQADTATYDRETIFDYIDGAGEVYRSFDFREVAVANYVCGDGAKLRIELFDMGSDADAYGVFSYGREQEEIGIGGGYELRGSVLSFWQNRFYVCVSVEESDASAGELLLAAARTVSQRLPQESIRPSLIDLLPSDNLVPYSDRYCHLHQALNYHYYLARENVLHLDSTTNAVLARYRPGSTLLLLVEYPDTARASSAAASFMQTILLGAKNAEPMSLASGKFASCEQISRYLIIVLESPSVQSALNIGELARARVAEFLSQGQ
jgi:hypothetical protein